MSSSADKRLDLIAAIDRLIAMADDMDIPRDKVADYRANVVLMFANDVANEARESFTQRAGQVSAADAVKGTYQ